MDGVGARLTIRDTGPPFQLENDFPQDMMEGGRGLHIVALLGHELHIARESRGSVVTVVLPVLAA